MLVVYAQVLSDLFLHDAAIEACTQAIALSPVHHDAYLQRGLIRLLTGNFERGFEDYEHRLLARYNMRMTLQQTEKFVPFAHRNPEIEDVKDKRLLIMEEQGIGDVIMFSGLLPDLLQFTQTFEVVVQARLIALMRRSFPEVIFHPLEEFTQDGLKRFDRLIMFGSLPHIFRREKNRFKKSSYLKADPDKVALWQKTLRSATDTKLIGISWRGGTAGTHARRRSIDFSKFCAMIGEERHHLVSLQFGDEEDKDLTEVTRIPAQQKWDLDDLAALISALDEVVTVQNTNVHICGALGKACTVIIPNIPEWRYGLAGEMYWYTSPRVIWQKDILDQA
jgi:ADP-heptose:LPS heptosyltransferase